MRYTTGLVMLLMAVGVLAWALRHRRRVLALISEDALARHMEKQADDPNSISAFGEIMRPMVLFALAWIGVKSVAAYFWMDGPKYLSLFDLGSLLALLVAYGYCITVQTRYRMSVALAAREAGGSSEQGDAPTASIDESPLSRAA